jgi:peroxiredoxin
MGPLDPGANAPALDNILQDAQGNSVSLKEAIANGPVLLTIYKSSCAASKAMLPMLNRIHLLHLNDGLKTYGVAQDSPNITRSFARRYDIDYPILIEGPGYPVSVAFNIRATPTVVLIKQGGAIAYSTMGFLRDQIEEIEAAVAAELGVTPVTIVTPDLADVPRFVPG